MKLVMTLVVRDEADIIETNLDYHLAQGVDFILATDHGSTDGTRELLRRYEREGVLRLICDDEVGHHQSRRVTHMAHLAGEEHGADWIFHNDADEFWWPVAGSLRDVFSAIPDAYGELQVWRRFNFLPVADVGTPFYERLIYRDQTSRNLIGDPLEPKSAHRPHPELVVAPGNHWLSGGDLATVPIADMIEIFHFPTRDYGQFERKVQKLGLGYEAAGPLSPEVGRDQLALLEVHRRGELPAYYADLLLEPQSRQRRIEEGAIVVDRRLQRFLAEMGDGGPPSSHAGGAAIQALVGRGLNAVLALEEAHERAGAPGEAAAQMRAEVDVLRRQLAVTEESLAATAAVLEQVRGSRLMRWTSSVRRVWYRISGA